MTAPAWGTHPDPTDPRPDCGHEFHGADGGRCPGCGWDSHPIPVGPLDPSGPFPWDEPDTCGVCVLVVAVGGLLRTNTDGCPTHGPADRTPTRPEA